MTCILKKSVFAFTLTICLFLSSCMNLMARYDLDTRLIESAYYAADRLVDDVRLQLPHDTRIITASFADINNLETSSAFGRMISECIASRLTKHGYHVIEMKLRKSVYVRQKQGEFLLSRKAAEIADQHRAKIIVVGTYAAAKDIVYVSAKMVNPRDGVIRSSYEYKLPVGDNTRRMLEKDEEYGALKIPRGPISHHY